MKHFSPITIGLLLAAVTALRAAGPEVSEPALDAVGEALPAAVAEAEPAPEPEADPTVIDSDRLEMESGEEETRFIFSGNVSVTGNNLVVLCDRLEVTTARFEEDGESPENPASGETPEPDSAQAARTGGSATAANPADLGRLRVILATGNVRITQDGREATAGRAELRPREGLIILTENPVFRDAQGTVSGPRIVLDQNRSQAVVEGTTEQRARVTLPSLPDFSPGSGRTRPPEESPREP